MKPLPEWTDSETAWLAGLLEGEGWFTTWTSGRGLPPRPCVGVNMADRDIIDRVAVLFGGMKVGITPAPKKHPHWSIQYRTVVAGVKAQEIMLRIRPHMGERRKNRIDELLKIQSSVGGRNANATSTADFIATVEHISEPNGATVS